jgi:ABC-type transporter Mla MlaB component
MIVGNPLDRAEERRLHQHLHVLLEHGGPTSVACEVSALSMPDIGAVAALARLQLTARRLGSSILLRHASVELLELLAFVGLANVLPTG